MYSLQNESVIEYYKSFEFLMDRRRIVTVRFRPDQIISHMALMDYQAFYQKTVRVYRDLRYPTKIEKIGMPSNEKLVCC